MEDTPNNRGPRAARTDFFVLALLAASLGLNVWLGLKVRGGPARPPVPQLKAGDALPSFEVVDAGRQPSSLPGGADGRPVVLYVFTRTCPWCEKNLPAVEALAAQRADSYRFVGLCLGPHEECFAAGGPSFSRYSGAPPDVVWRLGLGTVPQTIVVSADARVSKVWRGAFLGEQRRDVEGFFKVALPSGGDKGR
jgi:hypothetical protein